MPRAGCARGLLRAPYLRELISMFTTVTKDEWDINRDLSTLPSGSALESMASCDSVFSEKLANAICARLGINAFMECLHDLDLAIQELFAQNIAAHDRDKHDA